MHIKKKRKRNFHVNMLKQWYAPEAVSCLAEETVRKELEEIPAWDRYPGKDTSPAIGLTQREQCEIDTLEPNTSAINFQVFH